MSDQILARIAERFNTSHGFDFASSCVMLCYVGSQSHGTSIPNTDPNGIDDVDLMAVVIPPIEYLFGLHEFESWQAQWEELDVVVYSYTKFVRLLSKGNPNVLGTLWLRPVDYLIQEQPFKSLVAFRHLFASKAAYKAFAGYAHGQLQRMTAYSPAIQQEIDDLTDRLDDAGWKLQDIMDRRSVPMPIGLDAAEAGKMAERLRSLRAKYNQAYMGEKRRNLVVKYGYDTKNAAHLVRLLKMCIEFLKTGEMHVYRGDIDASLLKAIKSGVWLLPDVKHIAETLFADAKQACLESTLPDEISQDDVSTLMAHNILAWILS